MIKFIIASLPHIDPERDVCYTSLTGKATQVLLQKGNKNVSTLHKLLYISKQDDDGHWVRTLVNEIPYKVLVVDEISMVPNSILRDIARFPVYVLALGDPGQLPPLDSEDQHHLLGAPHVFLEEIMRQAQESEIIRLSMDVRAGKPLSPFQGKEVMVLPKKEYDESMLLWADQTLVATNTTRTRLNNKTRQLLGFEGPPHHGEKFICLRNNWDTESTLGFPLVNGTVGHLVNPYQTYVNFPREYRLSNIPIIRSSLQVEYGGFFEDLPMDYKMIYTGEKFCNWKMEKMLLKDKRTRYKIPLEFTYGYAATVWKFQGSSAKKILGIEENHPDDSLERRKYLYTMLTRAEEKIVIIKKT